MSFNASYDGLVLQVTANFLQVSTSFSYTSLHSFSPSRLNAILGVLAVLVFFCEIYEIFKNTFFSRTLPAAASVFSRDKIPSRIQA